MQYQEVRHECREIKDTNGERRDRGREGVRTDKKKDRGQRGRVDGHLEPLPSSPFLTPSSPPSLLPPSSYKSGSMVTNSQKKILIPGKPILTITPWSNPNSVNLFGPKTIVSKTIQPRPRIDLNKSIAKSDSITSTTRHRKWLNDDLRKLPPPLPPPSLPMPLPWPPSAFKPPLSPFIPPSPSLDLNHGDLEELVKFLSREEFIKKLVWELDPLNVSGSAIVEPKIEIDILGQFQSSKTYQLLSNGIESRVILDPGGNVQDKRTTETKLLLCKIVYEEIMLQSMRLRREWILKSVQSLTFGIREAEGVIPSTPISNILKEMNINKNCEDVDASTVFGYVFEAGLTQWHVGVTILVQETQTTSSLLRDFVERMEEIQLAARIELKHLTHARFHTSMDECLYLVPCFFEPDSRKKAAATLNTSCLKGGVSSSKIVSCSCISTFRKHGPNLDVTLLSDTEVSNAIENERKLNIAIEGSIGQFNANIPEGVFHFKALLGGKIFIGKDSSVLLGCYKSCTAARAGFITNYDLHGPVPVLPIFHEALQRQLKDSVHSLQYEREDIISVSSRRIIKGTKRVVNLQLGAIGGGWKDPNDPTP
ncbi:hypothetical protein L6452_04630 [Arctium lappa]|uniref:Uncharacterized protein n=1 Tax=Arctium lappa TaxID=4217 RepID=A0ACB9EE57_ARCLA|nr:hypothetical protein L6452_04630 [Arctium lappa]